ncbi:MAG: signal peptidase I, partial [Planctomycetota bacterium]
RETVEAFVVAFILALLFRAFIGEAFVIPTGSMAPTLMGAHKDLYCEQCGTRFQVGASAERRGPEQVVTVVAGMCPNCRHVNKLDLAGDSHHGTFNGDRILVSKYAYTIAEPERWDVIVFKFPGNPKQNYIKRLVGLPEETLSIYQGDIFRRESDGSDQILRKPADKQLVMRHHVYDTDFQAETLIESRYPSRFQPWAPGATSPPEDSWQVERSKEGLVATVESGDGDPKWLRYYHRWPNQIQWEIAGKGGELGSVDPYSSRAITDFYAYDCYVLTRSKDVYTANPSNAKFARKPPFRSKYESGGPLSQFDFGVQYGNERLATDGMHWVGDLMVEAAIEASKDCREVIVELVESGIQYQCVLDLENDTVALQILDHGQPLSFTDAASPSAGVSLPDGDGFRIRMSNFDDQLLVWIDDELVMFDQPTTFDSRAFRSVDQRGPEFTPEHPLDASPIGIAVRGGSAKIDHIKIDRDKYYIASKVPSQLVDYRRNELGQLGVRGNEGVQEVLATPTQWATRPIWNARGTVQFEIGEDQFFPMGDNSPESLDARCWAGTKVDGGWRPEWFREDAYKFANADYVPRDLLVGKALMVFWPHPWNRPVPMTPNFNRFRLIR